jgi:tetratricopeptide (TPR) repeat protein
MSPDRINCPRCGESLPPDLDRCDACGFDLSAAAARPSAASSQESSAKRGAAASRVENKGIPGIAWLLLVVGLVVGGMVGFSLHSAIGPRAESGMPTGPADIMAGAAGGDAPAAGGGMTGGAGPGAPQRMPEQIMQMVQAYKAALAKNPKDLEANIGLANLEFDSGQWDKAIEYYSRAIAIDPRNADVRVDRAIAYHATGKNDIAQKDLLQVTRERPDHKNAWLNLGVVSRELGDRAQAIRAWERYLELDPQGEHAAGIRQEIESLKRAG